MITFSTTGSARSVNRKLNNLMTRQINFAASKALNETGKVLLVANRKEMRKQFDKPVRYTLNAFYVKQARHNNLVMSVRRKDKEAGRHYLEVQHSGGPRPRKGIEKMLEQRIAYGGHLRTIAPTTRGRGATKNGGINMAEMNRALAGLNASYSTTAYTRNKQRAAESKRALQKRPSEYFVAEPNTGPNKTGGIYRRTPSGKKTVKVFHIFDFKPKYKKNFPFHPPLIKQTKAYFPNQMRRQLRAALRTARF